jgi:hypothetical protein
MTTCSTSALGVTIAIILIIAFADDIFTNFPVLTKLFTDNVNFILLVALVILVLMLDLPTGILLAFLILYLSVWVLQMLKARKEKFSVIMAAKLASTGNRSNFDNILSPNPLSDIPRPYTSESEINYNKSSMPNGNIAPFKPVDQSQIQDMTHQIQPGISCNQNDALSLVGAPNRDGYDCTGCRYDMKDSPQNLTKWGQPLARCSTYDANKVKTCGTVFYPLNA